MLNVGIFELMLIAGIALMVVGPEQLPQFFRTAGRWYGQARRAADELRRAFVLEADRQDAAARYEQLQQRRKKLEDERASFQPETVAQVDEPEPEFAGEGEHIGVDDAHGAVEEAEEVVNLNADAPDAPHPTRPVPASEESR